MTEALLKPNVVAIGVGFRNRDRQGLKELCIVCCVERKRPLNELRETDRLPAYFGDFRTDIVSTGRFTALARARRAPGNGAQTQRVRPVRPGISIGHGDVTAGTFGCVVERDGERLMLSNNHVIANGNRASLGSAILQPGPYDGGKAGTDAMARLVEFVPIAYDGDVGAVDPIDPADPPAPVTPQPQDGLPSGCRPDARIFRKKPVVMRSAINRPGANKVDCALAKPDGDALISTEILGIGSPRGIGFGTLGMLVQKSGRTTGLTRGEIEQIDVTSRVDYGDRVATFSGQLMASAGSAGGDSGAAVLDMSGNVIGLLFAGSATSTLLNPIQTVLDSLNVRLVTR
jgi:S1-C subfamily serine protease